MLINSILTVMQNIPQLIRSGYDAFDQRYIFFIFNIKEFFSQSTIFLKDISFKIGSSATWNYLCYWMDLAASAVGLLPFFLKASILATGFVSVCLLAKIFEVLFSPIQHKIVTRAN